MEDREVPLMRTCNGIETTAPRFSSTRAYADRTDFSNCMRLERLRGLASVWFTRNTVIIAWLSR